MFDVANKDKPFSVKLSHIYIFFMIEYIHYYFAGVSFVPVCIASF